MNKELYSLTNPQKSIWMIEKFYSETNINNICGTAIVDDVLDFDVLRKAINIVIKNNTTFNLKLVIDNNEVKQYLSDTCDVSVDVVELTSKDDIAKLENELMSHIFDIYNDDLFCFKIFKFSDNTGGFMLNIHHLFADSWTLGLVCKEIIKTYSCLLKGEEVLKNDNFSYINYINSEKEYLDSDKFKKDKEYWENVFDTIPEQATIPSSKEIDKNNFSPKANRKSFNIDTDMMEKINAFCKSCNVSVFNFFMGVYATYIGRVSGVDDFVLGTPILNRTNFNEKNTTGMFINIAPLRFLIDDNLSFKSFVSNIAKDSLGMLRHQKYYYQNILEDLRKKDSSLPNLYNVLISYQVTKANTENGLTYNTRWAFNGNTADDIDIHLSDLNVSGKLNVAYDYKIAKYDDSDIEAMHNRILHIIWQILEKNDMLLKDIEIVTPEEKHDILYKFNNTKMDYPKDKTIVDLFEEQVEKTPDNVAVVDNKSILTYKELNNMANIIAEEILNSNIKGDIVAFSLERSVAIIASILGILKSGHTYMPIDPNYPIDRINFMLVNSNCDLLITSNDLRNYNNKYIKYQNLDFDKTVYNLDIPINPNQACYIMYTSGSTGVPKAVVIKHCNVVNFVNSMQNKLNYNPNETNNVLSVTTVCFDIFVFEIYPTLLSGLTLVIANEFESKSPKLLSEIITKYKIEKILTTPSRIELLFSDSHYLSCLSYIKEFILGGEPFPQTLLTKLKQHTNAKIYNLYGPTETTVYSTFKDLTDTDIITIGQPIANTKIYILNKYNKLQPLNAIGEICIAGDGVGLGYYHNIEKTNSVFVDNPFGSGLLYKTGDLGCWQNNGELACLGRKDYQVKIRGYRIELDDVSNNILTFPNINKCVVVDRLDDCNKKYLCAYFTSNIKIDIRTLKKYLLDLLPNYMIPTYYMQLDELPLTLNHKIDRKALPQFSVNELLINNDYVKPTTNTEKILCKVFEDALNIKNIGITNDIFDYNIDSLNIIKIQTYLLNYNLKLNTQDFYTYRTIKDIAELLDNTLVNTTSNVDKNYLSTINSCFNKHNGIINFVKHEYNHILLVGATGYLGIHLLEELLSSSNAHITCLIRSKGKENACIRLVDLYNFYFNKNLDLSRISIIDSNITKQKLGLSKECYLNLSNCIDLVINVAANVRYYGNYSDFKKINVDVVSYLADFCIENNIHLVHISTLGVSGNYLVNHDKIHNCFDENNFYIGQKYDENVYIQTKFEAEKLIYEKIPVGLSASIFRVGNLTSNFNNGIFQFNFSENAFYNILVMILKYTVLPNTILGEFLEFTPVDFCAKAIYTLINNVDINKYVFHIFNDNYISVSNLIQIFENIGFNISILSGNDFKNNILSLANKFPSENILKGIVNDLDDTLGLSFKSSVNQQNNYTNLYLKKLGFEWPTIDSTYISKIINYLKIKKYI